MLLFELLFNWNLIEKVWIVTADNASKLCFPITKLTQIFKIINSTTRLLTNIHVRFIAHVINHNVLEYLKDKHECENPIGVLLQVVKASVQRRGIFVATQKHLGLLISLPSLHVLIWWSSTSEMICSSFKARAILNSIATKVCELRSLQVYQEV